MFIIITLHWGWKGLKYLSIRIFTGPHITQILFFVSLLFADVITERLKVTREAQEAEKQVEEGQQEAGTEPDTLSADGPLGDKTIIDTESTEDASSQGKSKRWHVKYIYSITVLYYDCGYVYFIWEFILYFKPQSTQPKYSIC